ncbi:MAG: acyloxyacyl hydrolase [Pseudomonadota bacterium]
MLLLLTAPPLAAEPRWGATLAAGEGVAGQRHDSYRLSLQRHWNRSFWQTRRFHFNLFWDTGVTLLDARDVLRGPADTGAEQLWILGTSPVLRWQFQALGQSTITPFLEAGVGLAVLSDDKLRSGNNRALRLGTRWQFEDRVAIGIRFGRQQRWELAWRLMHHSNLNAADDNAGLDSQLVSIGRRF